MKVSLISVSALSLAACHTVSGGSRAYSDYNEVVAKLGVEQTICGKLEERKFKVRSDGYPDYLDVYELGPLDYSYVGNVCVVGEVIPIGCRTEGKICTDWSADYAIKIISEVPAAVSAF